ncbi:hypothetical protein EX30DRAFT_382725 [Ascodesmis nigricans]|uniref:Splicing factor U2AF subunit n=1 Tax=Ascodesmis nigricans TaxID=341454 RepID=A0A4S2MPL6_9PEZI|nr:hypothetical protein EX30DRAFT_382725 [Ascodesmis nigricans]
MNGGSYSSRSGDTWLTGSSHHQSSSDRRDRDRSDRPRDPRERDSRRRSRSPHHRSRRDDYYGGGGDSAAAAEGGTRDRYREREERYGGGRDREYGRDRERRRGDRHDRSSRYEDRRGGGGGGGGRRNQDPDAEAFAANRRRSNSPPPKKREPTPDLTDIVPITERKRRMTMWDIKPQGYENVTAEQAKLSGMFPLPGAPRQAPMDPTRLHAFMSQPGSVAQNSALKPTNSRQAKRLLVSNLPVNASEESMLQFFNELLAPLNVTVGSPDPITAVQMNASRDLAMMEFKNTSDTTLCLAFSGIEYQGNQLEIRRPKDYIVPLNPDDAPHEPGQISSTVPDGPNKILITRIPEYLQDEQVIELLQSFGALKAFVLVKDAADETSKGIAFCEYVESSTTDIAVEGMNGMEFVDSTLKVQRASVGMKQAAGVEMGVNAMAMMAGTTSTDLEATRVLQLLNMVTPEELMDNEEYEEICEDIREECSKYGKLVDMKIPRPGGGSKQVVGVGKIFVRFEDVEAANAALKALAGRKFADRTVVCTYFSEENYEVGAF